MAVTQAERLRLRVVFGGLAIVPLFLGGWYGPGPECMACFLFSIMTLFFVMLFILLRAALPRPRYDHLMAAGWMVCLPLTLLNLLVTGAVLLME